MRDLDLLESLYIGAALLYQAVLIAYFAMRGWRIEHVAQRPIAPSLTGGSRAQTRDDGILSGIGIGPTSRSND